MSVLPENICEDIFNSNINTTDIAEDTIGWNFPKEADFSVKSAYNVLSKETQSRVEDH